MALPQNNAEETALGEVQADRLLATFRKCSRALLNLAVQCEAAEDTESAEGIVDVVAMLKEVQTEAEERRSVTAERRRERARQRAAEKANALPHVPD